jgi:hypothetical protein
MTKQEEIDSLLTSIVTWNLTEQSEDVNEYIASEKAKMNAEVKALEDRKNAVIILHLQNILTVLKHEQ